MAAFKLGIIVVRWPNAISPEPHPAEWYHAFYGKSQQPGIAHYWLTQSEGAIDLVGEVCGWLDLDTPVDFLRFAAGNDIIGRKQLADAAVQAAHATRTVFGGFNAYECDGLVVATSVTPPPGWTVDGGTTDLTVFEPGSFRSKILKCAVINAGDPMDFAAHEMGHVIGLQHSFGLDSFQIGGAKQGEYGHPTCIMSAMTYGVEDGAFAIRNRPIPDTRDEFRRKGPGLSGATRVVKGWTGCLDVPLTPDVQVEATLASLGSNDRNTTRVIRLLDPAGPTYTVEFRSPIDYYDRGLPEPMLIVSGQAGSTAERASPGRGTATFLGAAMSSNDPRVVTRAGFEVRLHSVTPDQRFARVTIRPAGRPWSGWFQLHPETSFNELTPVAAVSRDATHMDVFKIGFDGRLWSAFWIADADSWRPWFQPRPERTFAQNAPVTALARRADHLDVFVTGQDGAVWSTWWHDDNGGWRDWFQIHPETVFRQDRPVVALAREKEQIDLFRVGFDGAVWSSWWNNTAVGGWQRWFQIHPETRFSPDARVTAVARRPDHLDLFVVGLNGAVWSSWWHPDNEGWRGWFQIHPQTVFARDQEIVPVARRPDHLDLFTVGFDGAVWSSWWHEDATGWRPWFQIHPETKFDPGSRVTAIARASNHLDVFVTGLDGGIWSSWWHDDGIGWRPWFRIGAPTVFTQQHPVSVIARTPDHLDLFKVGFERSVWSAFWPDLSQKKPFSVRKPLYALETDGRLKWARPDRTFDGQVQWSGPTVLRNGLQTMRRMFSDRAGGVYAIQPDGQLIQYIHRGWRTGANDWSGPHPVGTGWQDQLHVFSGGPGIIYVVKRDGTLTWFHHIGHTDGTPRWAEARVVGSGWSAFQTIVSDDFGTIYGITPAGELVWHKHLGAGDGTFNWLGGNTVGVGWQSFRLLSSDGSDSLYAMPADGKLMRYRHDGRVEGAFEWSGPYEIGSGWGSVRQLF